MSNIEELFAQSNALLFDQDAFDARQMKDVIVSRLSLAKSISITDGTNSEFDKLISSLEYSIEQSDDLMALSLIKRINSTITSIADSFDNILTISNKKAKK